MAKNVAGNLVDTSIKGLTAAEVAERISAGKVNVDTGLKTRSIGDIFRDNICTLFNFVNVVLATLVFFTGSYKNMLFMIIIVVNVIIGIVQEIRSKMVTDKLSIVAASLIDVARDGEQVQLSVDQLVLDDVIRLGRGDQVPADAVVVQGACRVDESLLTGESKAVAKAAGDALMSGSFLNSGMVWARVVHVGADNYAAKITAEAKQHKAVNSEIMTSLNRIIKFVSLAMVPVGLLLFGSTHFLHNVAPDSAILSTVSALVGMIPEGLILLTSTVLAVAVIRLAGHKVLVQQLYCIETLARVDTLCLDKTGTITTGGMEVAGVVAAHNNAVSEDELVHLFASIAASDEDPNDTARAIIEYAQPHCGEELPTGAARSELRSEATQPSLRSETQPHCGEELPTGAARSELRSEASQPSLRSETQPRYDATSECSAQKLRSLHSASQQPHCSEIVRAIPFSSETKWSGAEFSDGAYVMGAAQFVLAANAQALRDIKPQLDELAAENRVLLLARVDGFTEEGGILGQPEPVGFIMLRDQIRSTAAQTIGYFIEQGVQLKVISGDDPHTVSGIAQKVGVPGAENYIDATTLKTDEQIVEAINKYSVFGRVTPEQKKAFVVALQAQGHIVAMTGDGVNDVLALKASDCSVAMASGSDAARNVAQLVLVDNDFASMPKVVAEGRRSINNLQRSASLFLIKTLFSITSAVLFIFLPWQYPFVPIQMTLISAFTIGLPSFVLALEPNHERVRGRFLSNCVVHSIPGAICAVLTVLAVCITGYGAGLNYAQVSTLCVLLFAFIGVMLVIRLSIPYNAIRAALLVVIVGGLLLGSTLLGPLFNIAPFTSTMWLIIGIAAAVNLVVFQLLYNAFDRLRMRRIQKS
ncbi:HAD-IC family P-type ATPase [Adlercreutzia sp. ZJ304]|uniref:HAD-IC family P-type ATPase n=1 Tax=Adlercreutzia sp. ZJ304 TaxID=2709791 RepID=UPI0013EC5038|nr:HAD-IC family P-type ATPase [Adlercreutzia sp. ZJ304]